MNWKKDDKVVSVLKQNGIIVMPTDTIYGIVGCALNKNVVERIYNTRQRSPEKPCIILINDVEDLKKFSVVLSFAQKEKIKDYWPGPVSIIFFCEDEKFSYLHRGTKTLAFRLPNQTELRDLLKESGPLLAPSANLEGMPPALNITEAKKYFGDKVDLYVDGGDISGKPSKIIRFNNDDSVSLLRE